MFTGVIVSLLAFVLLVFLFVYKREMIVKMFTLNMSASADEFNQQLEQTADAIIRHLEEEAAQLELLLEEAESKIGMLSQQVEHANQIIEQLTELENKRSLGKKSDFGSMTAESKIPKTNTVEENFAEVTQPNSEPVILAEENNFSPQEPINIEKHRLILTMAEQGYNITEIAKAVGMGKGEIMLLLQLNKK